MGRVSSESDGLQTAMAVLTGRVTENEGDISTIEASVDTLEQSAAEETALLAESGYQKFAGGLIMQWGRATVSAVSSLAVTFPVQFPNAALSGQVSVNDTFTAAPHPIGTRILSPPE